MKVDRGLLALFETTARNVEDTAKLLHALLADYPDHAGLAQDILACEREGDRLVHDILHRIAERGTGGSLHAIDAHALDDLAADLVEIHRLRTRPTGWCAPPSPRCSSTA